jgi:hypothetical protein
MTSDLASVIGGHCPVHGALLEPDSHLGLWQDWRAQQEMVSNPGSWCEPCKAWWVADAEAQTVTKRWPFPDLRL